MANDTFVFPVFFKDLNETTKDWTDEEYGAYIRLLIHQWSQGKIPSDMKRIIRIAESAEKHWQLLRTKFTLIVDNGLQNSRLEKIRKERKDYYQKQSGNGKKGGRPKKPKQNPDETQSITQTLTQTKPLLSGSGNISSNEEKEKKERYENFRTICLSREISLTELAKSGQKELIDMPRVLTNYNSHLLSGAENHATIEEYQRHLRNWLLNKQSISAKGYPTNNVSPKSIGELKRPL